MRLNVKTWFYASFNFFIFYIFIFFYFTLNVTTFVSPHCKQCFADSQRIRLNLKNEQCLNTYLRDMHDKTSILD